jgi:hypothetical protein
VVFQPYNTESMKFSSDCGFLCCGILWWDGGVPIIRRTVLHPSHFTLQMKAGRSSEKLVSCHIPKWRHSPEARNLNFHC